jgi:integrase
MSRRPLYIQMREGTYYFRYRVPAKLKSILGRTEYHYSLKTSDYREAKRLCSIEQIKVQAEIDRAEQTLAARTIHDNGARSLTTLTDAQIWALATQWFVEQEAKTEGLSLSDGDIETRFEDFGYLSNQDPSSSATASLYGRTVRFLEKQGIKLPSEAGAVERLSRVIHRAAIEHEKRLLNRLANASFALDPRFSALTAATKVHPGATMTFSELLERYRSDPRRPARSPKTKKKHDSQDKVFQDIIGARTLLVNIDREQVDRLLKIIHRLPPNWDKRFNGMSVTKVLELDPAKIEKPMSPVTANTYLDAFASVMKYAADEHLIERTPANGLKLPSDGIRAKDRRNSFKPEDLEIIFSAPLYAGCVDDEAGYAKIGPNKPRRGRFWVPLIALFSGMRLNEICQLTEDDIAVLDGTDVILIRSVVGEGEDDTKRVKTASGIRFVPVHPELVRIGFLSFVATIRAKHAPRSRLFPEIAMASTGYYSDNFSKWFANFRKKLGINGRQKTFHSFRHTYRDALREAEISSERVQALGGWSSGRTEDDYGDGFKASTLAREIAKLKFDGLDLAALYEEQRASTSHHAGE